MSSSGSLHAEEVHTQAELATHASFPSSTSTLFTELPQVELAAHAFFPSSTSTLFTALPGAGTELKTEDTVVQLESEVASKNETSLAPVDTGFGAWSFVAASCLVQFILWAIPEAFGVFLEAYLDDTHLASQPHAATLLPLTGTLSSGLMYCSSAFIYPFVARYPQHVRTSIWIGAVICFASLLGATYSTTVIQLVLLQGFLYGIGGALLNAMCISFLNEWFVARRGLAYGVILAGSSLGGIILPLVLPHLISAHGASKTLLILSICFAALILPALPFYKGRLPGTRRSRVPRLAPRSSKDWIKNPSFWVLMLLNTVQSFGYFLPLLWLPTFASELNLSYSISTLAVALVNGASFFGVLILGRLSDTVNPWLLALATSMLASISTFVLWGVLAHTLAGLLAFGIAYGLFACTWVSLYATLISPIADSDPTPSTSISGYLMLTRGVGNVLAGPISSSLIRWNNASTRTDVETFRAGFEVGGGRFETMIIYVGTCLAGAAGIALLGWGLDVRSRASRMRAMSTAAAEQDKSTTTAPVRSEAATGV